MTFPQIHPGKNLHDKILQNIVQVENNRIPCSIRYENNNVSGADPGFDQGGGPRS